MPNIIHVESSKLTASATVFQTTAGDVKNLTGDMTNTVHALTGRVWSGEAASSYTSKFDGLQGDINKLYQMIVKHSDHLRTIAKEYESKESENIAEAGRLSNSVI